MANRRQRPPRVENTRRPAKVSGGRGWLAPIGLVALVVVTFWNSQAGIFLLDDFASIHQNTSIREVWPPWNAFSPPNRGESVAGRPLVNVTLALNYAAGGMEVSGYHVVNIALHLLCVLLAFGVMRRLLRLSAPPTIAPWSTEIAFAIAGIWAVHPITTEVVAYIVARTESLMALCYLATIYASIRSYESAADQRRATRWNIAAVGAAGLGMLSKESMATAPVAILLIDRALFVPSFTEAFRARRSLYLGLGATLLVPAALTLTSPRGSSAGFMVRGDAAADVSLTGYLLNQALIVPHYFRLLVWPAGLVLDYGQIAPLRLNDVLPYATTLIVTCAVIGWWWFRNPRAALPLVLCLLILAPTTLVPIITEVGAERRIYLPALALIAAVLVFAAQVIPRKAMAPVVAALIGALALTSVGRNAEYTSTYGMWRTVVERRPHGRAYLNLAVAAKEAGRTNEVLPLLLDAVRDYPDAEYALGEQLYLGRHYREAIGHLETFLRVRSTHYQAEAARQLLIRTWTDLAIQESQGGRLTQAHDAFVSALKLDPGNPDLRRNVAISAAALQEMAVKPQ